ncbi:hypothetical protein GCM10017688_23750 [Streptomyces ramulosus]
MVHGDPGPGGFSGKQAGGGAEQVTGVHQDDAAIHDPPSSLEVLKSDRPPVRVSFGFPSSLPDRTGVNCRNSIFGVADGAKARTDGADVARGSPSHSW